MMENGEKISFFTDTGGGLFIYKDSAIRLQLIASGKVLPEYIYLPKFKSGFAIPEPLGSDGKIFVFENTKDQKAGETYDGMLGQAWFADRVWTFDYPNQKLILQEKSSTFPTNHAAPLGFKSDTTGKRILHFPRIRIQIGGSDYDVLLDTGATTFLTDEAVRIIDDGEAKVKAASFITNSVFEKWQLENPEWRVVEKAESTTGEAMIEVPEVKIANHVVGSVWFTRRADKNFHDYMSKFMDSRIEGAIGGNALRYFRLTVDYPRAIAIFESDKCKHQESVQKPSQ